MTTVYSMTTAYNMTTVHRPLEEINSTYKHLFCIIDRKRFSLRAQDDGLQHDDGAQAAKWKKIVNGDVHNADFGKTAQ